MDSRKEKHWYFLTLLKAKHASGKRPNRITGLNEGVWKATGCAIPIIDHDDENITLGYKRSFCYHQKKPKKGKTNWLMHELSTIDDNINWVLCEIHHHSSGSKSSQETKGASDAAPELFNTDDANYCFSTSQEPIAAMIPYHYDSQVFSSTNTMIDMEYDGNIQSVNNLCSLSALSNPCMPSNITIDMQFDGNMQLVNNLWSRSSSAPSISCLPSNSKIDMQFDGNMQRVNNLWSSSSSAPSNPCVPSNTMIDIQFVNNLWPCSSSAQSMPCVPTGLSREDDSRFPSFHQNLQYPVATLQSNGTFSGVVNLLGNAGMFCGLQGPVL
ncbi:hypothetical protein MRB53_007045 [Persea americana]|uniref:Uncharacterized protein n=1 Tax=Persea americana TaxID=3435 RepID=A0ACC2MHR8_PERAE|nr:hypothetical protein MRB53_007045 [Persea americana]